MSNVNWCLMAVSFALGLVLTLAFLIRRVKREVPVYGSGGGAARLASAAGVQASKVSASDVDADADSEPYGAGSIRLAGGAAAPAGWTVKGNENSMLYHTVDSPSYEQTVAEIWFRDEPTARGAGFRRWDEGKSGAGATGISTFVATEPELAPGPHGLK